MSENQQEVIIRIEPRKELIPYLLRKERWAVIVAHRRFGKTVGCIMDLCRQAVETRKKNARYAYVAPTYAQAKDVTWSYLTEFVGRIPGCKVKESELSVTLPNGARIRLYGSDNYDRMRGLYFDGVILDEPADMNPAAWSDVIRPALSDRNGWATFIGTPKGRNSFFRIWTSAQENPDWFTLKLPASATGIIPDAELEDAKNAPGMTKEKFDQEYECSFDAAAPGAIYASYLAAAREQGRINKDVLWYPNLPVYTCFDIGAALNQKVWFFQNVGDRVKYIESMSGGTDCRTPADWVKVLQAKRYMYGGHFLPHDGAVMWRIQMEEAGLPQVRVVPKPQGQEKGAAVWDGISMAQSNFPRCEFNPVTCDGGIDALECYHSKAENDGLTIKNVPVHDWASHYSDSFVISHRAMNLGWVSGNMQKKRGNSGAFKRRALMGTDSQRSGRRSRR